MIVKSDRLKVSASALKTYTQCPRKYYFTYIEKLPKKKWPHIELGNFLHDVLEEFHNLLRDAPKPDREWGAALRDICVAQIHKYELTKEQRVTAKEMLDAYLAKLRSDGMPNVLFNEKEFSMDLPENILLRGFIDRIDQEGDGLHIRDYKSGSSRYLDAFQLTEYALAAFKAYPDLTKVKGSYIILKEASKIIPYSISKTDTERCVAEIVDIAGAIRSDQTWETRPSKLCSFCDFSDACPATKSSSSNEWGSAVEVPK